MDKIMRIIKENNLNINNQKLEMDCNVYISVRKKEASLIFEKFYQLYEIEIKEI